MIIEPKKLDGISADSQWLSGSVGSGSWFFMQKEEQHYRIIRYSLEGVIECSRLFNTKQAGFEIGERYKFTFLSHCNQCTIIQNEITYKFYTHEY